jgi:hypothetical protein
MLVNKADRLSAPDLARVMESVVEALAETKIGAWSPPIAFSAKRALSERLGSPATLDAGARTDSGWSAVQELLDRQIVGRSAELKERALRRRATLLVARLLDAWTTRDAAERASATRDDDRARAAAHAATRIERDADAIAGRLAASLSPDVANWKRDLDLVFIGRDRDAADRDPVLARYRVDRAVDAVAPALARELSALAPEVEMPLPRMASQARAIVRAAAWGAPFDAAAWLEAIARAGIATLVEELLALSVVARGATVSAIAAAGANAAGVLRELRAFRAALEG